MAKNSKTVLKTLNRAIKTGATKGHILEDYLSQRDMVVLKEHLDAGTLMSGITPVADNSSRAGAVRNMPNDLGRIVGKIPADTVSELRQHLNTLDRDKHKMVACGC